MPDFSSAIWNKPTAAAPADDYAVENSLKFDGSSAYLSQTFASDGDTTKWTWASWVKRGKLGVTNNILTSGPTDLTVLQFVSDNTLMFYTWTGSSYNVSLQTTQVFRDVGAWYHIAVIYDSGNATSTERARLYVNGERVTALSTATFNLAQSEESGWNKAGVHYIGYDSPYLYEGYLADVYFLDGSAVAPEDNFIKKDSNGQWVPKDYDIESDTGDNSFHLPFSNTAGATAFVDSSGTDAPATFTDSSSEGRPVTVSGSATHTRAKKKVGETSMYFGADDGIHVPDSSDWALGTHDFTLECWIWVTGSASGHYIAGPNYSTSEGVRSWDWFVDENNGLTISIHDGSSWVSTASSTGVVSDDTWQHVATVRESGTIRHYVNGKYVGGGTNSTSFPDVSGPLYIGAEGWDGTYGMGGYMDEFRFSSGGTTPVRYSGTSASNWYNFTEASVSSAYTSDDSTLLLIHSDGFKHPVTAYGNTAHTRAVKKFGDSSIRFDKTNEGSTGTGTSVSGLSIPDHSDFDFSSTGTFTAEGWFRFDDAGGPGVDGENGGLISKCYDTDGHGDNYDWSVQYYSDTSYHHGGTIYMYSYAGYPDWDVSSVITADDTWYHIAVVSSGTGSNNVELFIDGVSQGTVTSGSYGTGSGPLLIGRADNQDNTTDLKGYADQIRISDSARYTTNFTPPATAFTDDSNTLLLVQSNSWQGGLAGDASGKANDFAATNLGSHDQMGDTSSAGKNYCTWNPLDYYDATSVTLGEGNLKLSALESGNAGKVRATFQMPKTLKWYWEIRCDDTASDYDIRHSAGLVKSGISLPAADVFADITGADWVSTIFDGTINQIYKEDTSATSIGSGTIAEGDIFQYAYDAATRKFWVGKNGTWLDSGDPSAGTDELHTLSDDDWTPFSYCYWDTWQSTANFGQDPTFNGNRSTAPATSEFAYTPPTDFKSLCTANIPDPALNNAIAPAFAAKAYDDGAGAKTGLGFQPDLVWVKSRGSTSDHKLTDSVRDVGESLEANTSDAEETESSLVGVTSFDDDGFTIGSNSSTNYADTTGDGMIAWAWKANGSTSPSANTAAGFSIVKWTGDDMGGSGERSIAHGLSSVELLICKARNPDSMNNYGDWQVWHHNDHHLILNSNAGDSSGGWGGLGSDPDATNFYVQDDGSMGGYSLNYDGIDYIAYCFASVEGYSKIGKYVGTNSNDGPFVYCGFTPAFIMVKSYSTGGSHTYSWAVLDGTRSSYNNEIACLRPNTDGADNAGDANTGKVDLLSNGFKPRYTPNEINGENSYVFLAIAENPFKHANAK